MHSNPNSQHLVPMPGSSISETLPEPVTPPKPAWREMLTNIGVAIVTLLKFAPAFLKTGGTMLLSVWVYAQFYGWMFAVGFILLILVHEFGHLIAARQCGLRVGAPVFIPFMGAAIALKEAPRNAWIEAIVGIGGPILGTVGALVCLAVGLINHSGFWTALAYTGFFLNLFNLAPVLPLDGGRIVTAISPRLWIIGTVIMVPFLIYSFNFIILVIVLMGLPRTWRHLRGATDEDTRYYECSSQQRFIMGTAYFGLIAGLALGMWWTHSLLGSRGY